MAETVRRSVGMELAEIKATVERLEERAKRNDNFDMEKMTKLEERLKESEDKEAIATERLEKIEDRLKENEEGKGQDKVSDRMEKIEEKINETEDKLVTLRKDKDKEKELEDRLKDNEERMESLRKAGDRTKKKESVREMKDKIEAAGKKLKYFGVDLGTGSRDRRELVNRTLRCFQDSVSNKK